MLLPELQRLAGDLGIAGTGRMRKGDLVAAISARQVAVRPRGRTAAAPAARDRGPRAATAPAATAAAPLEAPVSGGANGGPLDGSAGATDDAAETTGRRAPAAAPAGRPVRRPPRPPAPTPPPPRQAPAEPRRGEHADGERTDGDRPRATATARATATGTATRSRDGRQPRRATARRSDRDRQPRRRRHRDAQPRRRDDRTRNRRRQPRRRQPDGHRPDRNDRNDRGGRPDNRTTPPANDRNSGPNDEDDDDFEGSRGRRGRRYRDRNRRGGTPRAGGGRDRFDQGEPTVSEDDVLLPVAGILDVLDNYAFVRTSGYLTGPNDVYVSLSQVRRYGLRRGDAITGAVRQPREGERKDKYNALVRLDTVNGLDPEQARNRPEFTKLTPLYPQERLRLETEPHLLTSRVMDLVMPIGKGQRALIVSPPKAGKTMVLQSIANAITTNNPECHLMVVLVDERPEEVTDMQRSVKGEVIASTFDRPPSDHTTVAELSIERAKRLVEMGHDVVVLLDSITRLGRAYNLAAPASGRILSGGVDSTALYPPKRFLGAARNIENGGSLTIIASALVETGSTMDTVIFEEFKGTGNAEIKLDRRLADKRVFPAVDVNASGTRKEEILMTPDELAIVIKLRRVLAALEPQQALELLLDKLKKTRNNVEFLMQIQKTTLGPGNE